MSLRLGLGLHLGAGVRGQSASPVWTPADLSPDIYFDWQLGTTGTAPVTAWANQGSAGGSVAEATHGPDVGASALTFGATDYMVGSAKSIFNPFHQGIVSEAWLVEWDGGTATKILRDTNSLSTSVLGSSVYFSSNRLNVRAGNGAAGTVFQTTSTESITAGTRLIELYLTPGNGSTAGVVTVYVDGALWTTANTANAAPGVGDSFYDYTMCARGTVSAYMVGGVRAHIATFGSLWSSGDRASLRTWAGL